MSLSKRTGNESKLNNVTEVRTDNVLKIKSLKTTNHQKPEAHPQSGNLLSNENNAESVKKVIDFGRNNYSSNSVNSGHKRGDVSLDSQALMMNG